MLVITDSPDVIPGGRLVTALALSNFYWAAGVPGAFCTS